jgi:Zn-dependent protease with chaperone function
VLQANYFDGRTTRVHAVELSLAGQELRIEGADVNLRMPFGEVMVDERLGRAPRRLRFKNGSFCEVRDLAELDKLLSLTAHRDGWVDRMQRHRQFILLSCVMFVLLLAAAYRWGLPWAAVMGAHRLPAVVGKTISDQTLNLLDGSILMPSKIDEGRERALSTKFHALHLPQGGTPDSMLLFRRSPQLGANAFTLPDGTIILLDDLVTQIDSDPQVLAVLSHELGHVHGRHSLQLMLQSSAVGAFWTFYVGDISGLLAAAPAAVVQAHYSQDLERQADDYAAALLVQNGMSPALLADALKKLTESHPVASQPGFLSSHPSTVERMRRLRAADLHNLE